MVCSELSHTLPHHSCLHTHSHPAKCVCGDSLSLSAHTLPTGATPPILLCVLTPLPQQEESGSVCVCAYECVCVCVCRFTELLDSSDKLDLCLISPAQKEYWSMLAYNRAKLCNLLFSADLPQRLSPHCLT